MALDPTIAGLPVERWVSTRRQAEALAQEIVADCPSPNQRKVGDVWATLAMVLLLWHAAHRLPLSDKTVEALRQVLAPALDSPPVKARLGLPRGASGKELPQFLLAAQLDGEADAAGGAALHRDVLSEELQVSPRTIDAWRKLAQYISRRKFVSSGSHVRRPVPKGMEAQQRWVRWREARRGVENDLVRRRIALKSRARPT
jgi:hypothetical protein